MFSATVATRSSYTFDEVVYGAKFVPMYARSEITQNSIYTSDKLNKFEIVFYHNVIILWLLAVSLYFVLHLFIKYGKRWTM
jgi:hypothetical protein